MYLVTIINDNVETVINQVSTNNKASKISGTIKQGINTIDSFTFTIYPNNNGYNLITPLSTLVKVLNIKTNKYEFIGRVLTLSNSMDNSGLVGKTFVCESELAYLLDTYQSHKEIHSATVREYLEMLIRVHNDNTDSHKQFKVGNVNVIDNNDSLYRYIAYDTTKKNIDDDLINSLGGELQIRYENDVRYLDYLTEIGKVCNTEIRLAKNLQDITQDVDLNGYCNRLIVLGAKLKSTDDEGNEVDIEERLTIKSVNNGIRYIDDKESIAKYGIIQGQVIYDDVTDAKNLLTKGKRHLLNQRILISNKVNALDLSLIGIDIDSFEVGNYYPLKHKILGIDDVVRIVEKSISIDDPSVTSITLGDLEKDIKKYNIDAKKGYYEAKLIAQQANSKVNKVENNTKNEIYRVDNRINAVVIDVNNEFKNINNSIDNSNIDLTQVKKDIINLTNSVNTNTTNINSITTDLSIIKSDVSEIKNDTLEIKNSLSDIKVNTDKITNLEAKIEEILQILKTP